MNPADMTFGQLIDQLETEYDNIMRDFTTTTREITINDAVAILAGSDIYDVKELFKRDAERFLNNQEKVLSFTRRCIKGLDTVSDKHAWIERLIDAFPSHKDKIMQEIVISVRED